MAVNLKTGLILFLITIVYYASGQDHEFSGNTLKYGVGVGSSDSKKTTGGGALLYIGYQRDLWKNKLHLNPNLTVGYFSTKNVQDVRDQWFNSVNLETILYFDLLQIKDLALIIGAGGVINNTKGLLGTGGRPPSNNSDYINDWHYGGYLGFGVRFNPRNSRISIEMMPFNAHFGPDYQELFARIGIGLKFKA